MKDFYAKTKEGDLLRVTLEDVENPVNPREDPDKAIGTMFLLGTNEEKDKSSGQQYEVNSMYEFFSEQLRETGYNDEVSHIDEQVAAEEWGGRKIDDEQIENGVPYIPHNKDWGTRQLFDLWKKDLCAAVPIYHYNRENKGEFIRETGKWDKDDPIAGVMYVDWDDPQLNWHIDHEGKKIAQEWAEQKMRDEIYKYNCYLNKQAYKVTVSVFNKYEMRWGDKPNVYDNTYPNHFVPYQDPEAQVMRDALLKTGFWPETYNEISAEEAHKIETTLSPECKQVTGERFIEDIKEALPQFGGDIRYAQKAVAMAYRRSDKKMQLAALGAYLKENGCTTEEKTMAFLSEKVGAKEQALPQLHAGQDGCTTLVARDRYNQTRGGVVIDYQNKVFALWQGQGDTAYADGKVYPDGSTTKKASWKNCVEKAKEMLKCGFKEGENFNPDARITTKEALKTIKSREKERGR